MYSDFDFTKKIASKLYRNFSVAFFVAVLFLIFSIGVFAAPPNTRYAPGETLNPTCGPTDTNCAVDQIYVNPTTLNYAIGTSTSYAKLVLWGVGTTTGKTFEIANNASTTLFSVLDNGTSFFLGNLGIGTTTPLSKLAVSGGASVGADYNIAAPTNGLIVEGNVGVGVTNPSLAKLQVNGDAYVTGGTNFYVTGEAGARNAFYRGGSDFQILRNYNQIYTIQQIWAPPGPLTNEREATLALVRGDEPNQEYIDLYNNGYIGETQFGIRVQKRGTGAYRDFVFDQYDGVTKTPLMMLKASGNIGIGTTTPGAKLDVNGNIWTATAGSARNAAYDIAGNHIAASGSIYSYDGICSGESTGNCTGTGGVIMRSGAIQSGANVGLGGTGASYFMGNVGFGTSTPASQLHTQILSASAIGQIIQAAAGQTADLTQWRNSAGGNMLLVDRYGRLVYGTDTSLLGAGASFLTTDPAQVGLVIRGLPAQTGDLQRWQSTGGVDLMAVKASGNLGLGTSTPTAQLHTTGTVRFSNFGAGTLTTDANGNVTVASDERLKDIQGDFTRGLADLANINPILYKFNATSGLDTLTQYAGFSAQNVQKSIPEAVFENKSGFLSLQDRPIVATLVNAVKEIGHKIEAIVSTISNLASRVASLEIFRQDQIINGITTKDRITGEDYCAFISGGVLKTTKGACPTTQVATVLGAFATTTTMTSAPITIAIQGNNPATILVGSTYGDLGAIITAPDSAKNLGIKASLDGGAPVDISQISVDTSTPSVHHIVYSVVDLTGATTTAERILNVITFAPLTSATSTPATATSSTSLFISSSTSLLL